MTDRIEKTIELKAPIERVWRALVDHEEFGAWFRVRLEGPFEVGKETKGQIIYPGYEHYRWISRTVEIDEARHRLAFTWNHPADPTNAQSDDPKTLVEFQLEPTATGTRLHLVESGFESLPEARRADIFRGNEEGWRMQMDHIRAHVEG